MEEGYAEAANAGGGDIAPLAQRYTLRVRYAPCGARYVRETTALTYPTNQFFSRHKFREPRIRARKILVITPSVSLTAATSLRREALNRAYSNKKRNGRLTAQISVA